MTDSSLQKDFVREITVVIPAYNEETRLPSTLRSYYHYLSSRPESFEIIVVDDCSKDGTANYVRSEQPQMPHVKLISYSPNRGKGYAVRTGVFEAEGKLILFADADGSTPIEELERLRAAIKSGAGVAIGSRAVKSRETHVDTRADRKIIGRVFAALTNCIVLPGISDSQCGFKLFTREAARFVFPRQTSERFSFDVELLLLARIGNFKIAEVPVNWHNVDGSKVNILKDSAKMFADMVGFRLRWLRGGYR